MGEFSRVVVFGLRYQAAHENLKKIGGEFFSGLLGAAARVALWGFVHIHHVSIEESDVLGFIPFRDQGEEIELGAQAAAFLLIVQVDLRNTLIVGDLLVHHASLATRNLRHIQGLGLANLESSAGIGYPKICKQSFSRLKSGTSTSRV